MGTIYNFFSLIYFFLATQDVNKHPLLSSVGTF